MYRKNELFVKISEKINFLAPPSHKLLSNSISITGIVELQSYIPNYPSLNLQISDYMLSSSAPFSSTVSHPSTSLSFLPHDTDFEISFDQHVSIRSTSPFLIHIERMDGFLKLMQYTITQYSSKISNILTLTIDIDNNSVDSTGMHYYYYFISIHSKYTLDDVTFTLPIPTSLEFYEILSVDCMVGCGSAQFRPEIDAIKWNIMKMYTEKYYRLCIKFRWINMISTTLKSSCKTNIEEDKYLISSPINAQFVINNSLLSNRMNIDYIQLEIFKKCSYSVDVRKYTCTDNYYVPIKYNIKNKKIDEKLEI